MGTVPVLKPREVVALLNQLGFRETRQSGSHKQFKHADGRSTTVPFHKGRDIAPTLLRQIAKDIGLSAEQLISAANPDESNSESRNKKLPPPIDGKK